MNNNMGCVPSKSTVAGSSKPKVLVLGASGNVGKATLSNLVSRHGTKLRISAGVRDVEKFGTMDDVNVIQADMGDKNGLSTILKEFDRVYFVTPGSENRTDLINNGIYAAKEAGIKFALCLSVLTTETDSLFGKQFRPIEENLKSSGLGYAIVRLPLFIDNFYANAQPIKDQSTFYDPRGAMKPHTPISVNDVGKASADILANPTKHHAKTYKLVMPSFTLQEAAEAFSRTLGKDVSCTTVPYDAAKESFLGMGFPEWQVDGIMEIFHFIDEGENVTNEVTDSGDMEKITGEKPMTLQDWVDANKAGFS